jgi:hypothetical protein
MSFPVTVAAALALASQHVAAAPQVAEEPKGWSATSIGIISLLVVVHVGLLFFAATALVKQDKKANQRKLGKVD